MSRGADRNAVLIGIGALDWTLLHPLLDAGRLPALSGIVDRGISGTLSGGRAIGPIAAWNSLSTGVHPHDHGILARFGFDASGARPVPAHAGLRRAPAVWEMLHRAGITSHVVGWPAGHGDAAPGGASVSEAFGHPMLARSRGVMAESVAPAELVEHLAPCWMPAEEIEPRVLHEFFRDRAGLAQVPKSWLAAAASALAYTISLHAAFTWLLEQRPWRFAAVHLPLVEWLIAHMRPYRPETGSAAATPPYRAVIEAAYTMLDMMIGRIAELAGPGAALFIVSPYGLGSGPAAAHMAAMLERPAGQRTDSGFIAAGGPALGSDRLVHGATALDLAPTLLHYFYLPVGRDMGGRVLLEMFRQRRDVETIASWRVPGGGRHSTQVPAALSSTAGRALRAHFAGLGVVDPLREFETSEPDALERLLKWQLARSYLDGHLLLQALPLLEALCDEEPENGAYALQLANCQLQLGLHEEARETLELILADHPDSWLARICLAHLDNARGRHEDSLRHLQGAAACGAHGALLDRHLGHTYLQLRRWAEACDAFGGGIERNGPDAIMFIGLARALLGLRRFDEAADAALSAIGLDYRQPIAHYLLGIALLRSGRRNEAVASFEVAARLAPHSARAQLQLLRLRREADLAPDAVRQAHKALAAARAAAVDPDTLREAARRRARQRQRERDVRRQSLPVRHDEPDMGLPVAFGLPLDLTIVAALPGAGAERVTALLRAGGMDVLGEVDTNGGADGWRPLRDLPRDPTILEQAQGKVVAMPSVYLSVLPRLHHYRIIYVHRALSDILSFQQARVSRAAGATGFALDRDELARLLTRHGTAVVELLRGAPNVELLEVHYERLWQEPHAAVVAIRDFLGDAALPHAQAMAQSLAGLGAAAAVPLTGMSAR